MLIALLTDFGRQDLYVGSMRLVIASIAKGCPVVDLSHDIEPFAVDHGAFFLEDVLDLLPPESVTVAVVDPGVGTRRRAIALRSGNRFFVGPDNGLFDPVLRRGTDLAACEIQSLRVIRAQRSPTFDGRDLFASAAAHLACGMPFAELGPRLDPELLQRLDLPKGRIRHIDRFGNLVTDLGEEDVAGATGLRVGETTTEWRVRTYGEAPPGSLVWYLGSSRRIEIALVEGNAARQLGVSRGTPVEVTAGP